MPSPVKKTFQKKPTNSGNTNICHKCCVNRSLCIFAGIFVVILGASLWFKFLQLNTVIAILLIFAGIFKLIICSHK